jgi:hypothetical protein
MREVAATIAPIMQRNGIPAVYLGRDNGSGKRGMIGHRDVPDGSGGWGGSSHHDDPGANFDWHKFTTFLSEARANAPAPPPPPTTDSPLLLPGSAVPVVLGFKGYLLGLGQQRFPQDVNAAILSIVGLPQAPEYLGKDGNVYQVFERTILQFNPKNAPPFDVVMMRREDSAPEAA